MVTRDEGTKTERVTFASKRKEIECSKSPSFLNIFWGVLYNHGDFAVVLLHHSIMACISPSLKGIDRTAYHTRDLHGLTPEDARSILLCEADSEGGNPEHRAMVCASLILSRLVSDDAQAGKHELDLSLEHFWTYLMNLELPEGGYSAAAVKRCKRLDYHSSLSFMTEISPYSRKTKTDEELCIHPDDSNHVLGPELELLHKLLVGCYCQPGPSVYPESTIPVPSNGHHKEGYYPKKLVDNILKDVRLCPSLRLRLVRVLLPELNVKNMRSTLQLLPARLKSILLPVVDECVGWRNLYHRHLMRRLFISLWIVRFTILQDSTFDSVGEEVVWYKPTELDLSIIERFIDGAVREKANEELRNSWHCESQLIRQDLSVEELSFRKRIRDDCLKASRKEKMVMDEEFKRLSKALLADAIVTFRMRALKNSSLYLNIDMVTSLINDFKL